MQSKSSEPRQARRDWAWQGDRAYRHRLRGQSLAGSLGVASLLAQQRVEQPAAAHVLARLTAMAQEGDVGAAGVLERVAQYRHCGEVALVVDALRQAHDKAVVP